MAINKEELLQALSELPELYQALQDGYKKGDSTTETEDRIKNLTKKISDSKEIEELSKPLVEWLRKNRCPLDNIIITDAGVYVMSGELFIPTREIINEEEKKDTIKAHTASDSYSKKDSYEVIEEYRKSCAKTLLELSKHHENLIHFSDVISHISKSVNELEMLLRESRFDTSLDNRY